MHVRWKQNGAALWLKPDGKSISLRKRLGQALMQMEVYEKEKDRRTIEQITQRFVPIDGGGVISRWNLPVILSFGKVLPGTGWISERAV